MPDDVSNVKLMHWHCASDYKIHYFSLYAFTKVILSSYTVEYTISEAVRSILLVFCLGISKNTKVYHLYYA